MTPEQKREQLLKRVLPAMAITVIYFVFISGIMSDKMQKAEKNYQDMQRKGISKASMPGILSQSTQVQKQIGQLKQQKKEYQEKLNALAGFLSNAPSIESTARLSKILANNGIKIADEKTEAYLPKDLGPSLQEIWDLLKPPVKTGVDVKNETTKIYVQHLWLRGGYQAMYNAMDTIARSDELKAAPILFTLNTPVDETESVGDLEWELILWM
ncbi:MAG: hypothetical protein CVV06_14065 [Gammaproteobacteria bacterium HGW-Gammaproteobacteria-10]|jgi:FtsZ-binding cell division protein ZapB|nr:MAG: hypothetical protein CVV13_14565 [Gammaproteobacteria bacterium HGW-Gammaproteobacteria-3]PKM35858.1 MAG: hypothetical protein CVV06_14065 [Gammaproteobacteria bacterium HGW-Gammaproteobacteria-10]